MQQQPPIIEPTDGELLMRFCGGGDDEAFRLLVQRHAGLVYTVCQRVLVNRHDAEDAFQATFLVLARRATAVRRRDSVASWLFKVAHRTAIRAARDSRNRSECQLTDDVAIPSPALAHLQDRETFELLAAELNRLPESYRAPLILFYLEGKSRQAAADELDVSDAALKARLTRGRRLLRRRLMRRGVALSLAMAAVTAASNTGEAAVASTLVEKTIAAGLWYVAAGKAPAVCSARTVSLAKGVQPMLSATITKTALAAGVLLTAGLLVTVGIDAHTSFAGAKATGNPSHLRTIHTIVASDRSKQPANALPQFALADGVTADTFDPDTFDPAADDADVDDSDAPPLDGPLDLMDRSEAEERIEAAFYEETAMEFVDTPLGEAMEFLSQQHGIQILIDEAALAEEGVATDEPITRKVSGVSLRSGLNIVLKPLGLTYVVEDEVLKITTVIAEVERQETRVYLVNSLVAAGFEMDELQRVVEQQGEGEVDALPGVLVVTASQHAHRKTMQLLEQLRRAVELRWATEERETE